MEGQILQVFGPRQANHWIKNSENESEYLSFFVSENQRFAYGRTYLSVSVSQHRLEHGDGRAGAHETKFAQHVLIRLDEVFHGFLHMTVRHEC